MKKFEQDRVLKFKKENNLPNCVKISILFNSLIHTSYFNNPENRKRKDITSNERLEFFGDAVLDMIIAEYLYKNYELKEGDMAKIKATVASEVVLAEISRKMNIGKYIFMGKGEEKMGGRNKNSILADAFEAFCAAIYLSCGYEKTKEYILRFIKKYIEDAVKGKLFFDYKTKLQEITQDIYKVLPKYKVLKEMGPSHDRIYEVGVYIMGDLYGVGRGRTKREAEQKAARLACEKIERGQNKGEKR